MPKPGVVYTKSWVVDFVLDVAGYSSSRDLVDGCVLEPSCGGGAFLRSIVERLCQSAKQRNRFRASLLMDCVRAYDLNPQAIAASKTVVSEILTGQGMSSEDAPDFGS